MAHLYILDENGDPQPVEDPLVWARWFHTANRTVSCDLDEGDSGKTIRVSTVFLGIDHSFSFGRNAPPVLWETMVFGGVLDGEMDRYTSKEAAALGHQEMCQRVSETLQHPGAEPKE